MGRGAPITAFLFCQLFSLCLVPSKRKAAKKFAEQKNTVFSKLLLTRKKKSCIITWYVSKTYDEMSLSPRGEGNRTMAEVKLKEGETLDSALRRFKRQCARSGVLAELRKREHYEKPSVKRKKKSEAARKRKYK